MDEYQEEKYLEMDKIHDECLHLYKYLSRLRRPSMPAQLREDGTKDKFTNEGKRHIDRIMLQITQAMTFVTFITKTADGYLQLLQTPEYAEEIGREGLQKIHTFLEEYANLMSEEYSLYQ